MPDQDADQVRQSDNRGRSYHELGELSRSPGWGTAALVGEEGPGLRARRRPDNPWLAASPSGAAYAAHFDALAARGVDIHAEARLVASLVAPGGSVLDAGCGTGRVAIRLAELGHAVVGVDLDASMLAEARRRAPHLDWQLADLANLDPPAAPFDAAVAAGNVFPYLTPGTGAAVLVNLATQLRPGGLLIAGFTLDPTKLPFGDSPGERVTLAYYDTWCTAARLSLVYRWAVGTARPTSTVTTRSASTDVRLTSTPPVAPLVPSPLFRAASPH